MLSIEWTKKCVARIENKLDINLFGIPKNNIIVFFVQKCHLIKGKNKRFRIPHQFDILPRLRLFITIFFILSICPLDAPTSTERRATRNAATISGITRRVCASTIPTLEGSVLRMGRIVRSRTAPRTLGRLYWTSGSSKLWRTRTRPTETRRRLTL